MILLRAALVAFLAGTVAVGVWQAGAAEAQAPVAAATPILTAPGQCKICHESAGKLSSDYLALKSDEFIRCNESSVWEKHDPHEKAFAVLSGPIGKMMNENLRKMLELKYTDVTKDVRCLTCHAMDRDPAAKEKTAASFVASESFGIACAGCHGLPADWQNKHKELSDDGKTVPWRTMSPEAKAKAGMKNLRDPHEKAALCASCHVGNAAEGKIVTHDMYAAGHPPLLPFELGTFLADEPRHWGTPFDDKLKNYFGELKPKMALDTFSYHAAEGPDGLAARQIAIGALAALEAEAGLLVNAAEHTTPMGLDYARFDCYACHHDLKIPSDRQKRGYEGAPGRPPLKAWNNALVRVIVEHAKILGDPAVAALAANYDALWKKLQAAVTMKPFGEPAKVKDDADAMAKWCAEFAKALKEKPLYSPEQAKKLKEALAAAIVTDKVLGDAEAVMALVWAYRALGKEDGRDWDKINEMLPVSVRTLEQTARDKPATVGDLFELRLKHFNQFEAEQFRKLFAKESPPIK